MARLGTCEIKAIETMVEQMSSNLEKGCSALSYNTVNRKLLGATLKMQPSGFTDVDLDVSAIRANYSSDSVEITLQGSTWYTQKTPVPATLTNFRKWVTAVLAHEVCHLLQHRQLPEMFVPGSCATEAKNLSNKADSSGLPKDYVAYVSCYLEMEAHATQLAAELRPHGQLDRTDFNTAAKASCLLKHIEKKSTSPDGEVWPDWDNLEANLVNEAWLASKLMWGCQGQRSGATCQFFG